MVDEGEGENELEYALRLAADDASARPAFYDVLLKSDVYILSPYDGTSGARITQSGETLTINKWNKSDGSQIIPFFTSVAVLTRSIENEESYLGLSAKVLFEMTLGETLVLNARSPYGKEFHPQEIQALLSNGTNHASQTRITEKMHQIQLGQPKEYPTGMLSSLGNLFSKYPIVTAAYLALMFDPEVDEKPHLLLGIEAGDDCERVFRAAGAVAGDMLPKGDAIDLIRVVRGTEGVSGYFIENVKPFYQRD